jgi:hypothetical protein
MRLATVLLASLVALPVADAKPLYEGMTVTLKKGRPIMTSEGVSFAPGDDTLMDWDEIKGELSEDGKSVTLKGTRCGGKIADDQATVTYPLTQIVAKMENSTGESLLRNSPADAIPHFWAAIALDPEIALYASNLTVAQVKAGKMTDAETTLLTLGKQHMAWFAWKLAVDPAFGPLKGRAAADEIAAKVPGQARGPTLADAFAFSPLGMVATRTASGEGGSGAELPMEVSFTDMKTGREVLRLPMTKGAPAALIDELLVTLGFKFDGMFQDIRMGRSQSTNDGRAMLISDGKITYQVGSKKTPVTRPNVIMVGFVPKGAAFITRYEHVFRCDDKSYRTELHAMPDP